MSKLIPGSVTDLCLSATLQPLHSLSNMVTQQLFQRRTKQTQGRETSVLPDVLDRVLQPGVVTHTCDLSQHSGGGDRGVLTSLKPALYM